MDAINKVHKNKNWVNLIKIILIVEKFKGFFLTLELFKHMKKCIIIHDAIAFLFLLILINIF